MPHTFEEKLAYNKALCECYPPDSFAKGYCFGAQLYRAYPTLDSAGKQSVLDIIENVREIPALKAAAKLRCATDLLRDSYDEEILYNKGVMCGYRDAANERKRKSGPAPPRRRVGTGSFAGYGRGG